LCEPGPSESVEESTAEYCLNLPGKTLYLTHLLALKKFRKRGNKDGALRAFQMLDNEGLGKLVQVGSGKGSHAVSFEVLLLLSYSKELTFSVIQQFEFFKEAIPQTKEEKTAFAKKLAKFNVSLSRYSNILMQTELKP